MYQKVIVIGNLGADMEMRYMPNGNAVGNFRIAASEKWKNQDGSQGKHSEWFRCAMFGKRAEALEPYLKKGKQVAVEGRLRTRKWQDKDGRDQYSTDLRVDEITLLGSRREERSGGNQESPGAGTGQLPGDTGGQPGPDDFDDDIPF